MSDRVAFATLGQFIIDVFEFADDKAAVDDQIGGGGTYAAVAARMFLPPERVGMIVDRGRDWTSDFQTKLDSYGPCWVYGDDKNRLTTKARATYNGETRGFQYLTERKRISPNDLAPTRLAAPEYLHFVCAPGRAIEIIAELDTLGWTDTKLVYEPIPDLCIPSEMPALRQVLPRIHYFSPNHEEAGSFFGLRLEEDEKDETGTGSAASTQTKAKRIEELAQRFLDEGAQNTVAIRSGRLGAYAKQRDGTPENKAGAWHRPYYWPTAGDRLCDVTGAGNAFLGGFIAALALHGEDIERACMYGSVASSYTLEQYGLPTLGQDGRWNGRDTPLERVEEMRRRLASE